MKFLLLLLIAPCLLSATTTNKPNILFISVDDLNDWISPLGGHPQSITPNFQRLANQSVLFTNAHCPAPACGPCRAAVLSGIPPYRSGLYENMQPLRQVMPDITLMPRFFSNHGYHSSGSGKILHYVIDPRSWDNYFPEKEKDNPFPFTHYPDKRPVSLSRGGPWQYIETDWGPLEVTDKEFGGDYSVAEWVSKQLANPPTDKPFFLACGFYRPHEPWFVPAKYFAPFPLEKLQLPPGYLPNDLDDIPPAGQALARNRYFPHIQKSGEWKAGVQGYLASIHFADAMLGNVLDALDQSPRRKNTIVVLWSDHGWHLGEKEHWQKFTGWRACSRVPMMILAPGINPSVCDQPVSTIDLFKTLTSLSGITAPENISGTDLSPLLKDPNLDWPHIALTQLRGPDAYALSGKDFRYIHYANDEEELYNISEDQYEHTNLAKNKEYEDILKKFREEGPSKGVPLRQKGQSNSVKKTPLVVLDRKNKPLPSRKSSTRVPFAIKNSSSEHLQIFWINQQGQRKAFGKVHKASNRIMQSHVGHSWVIENEKGKFLGSVIIPKKGARITIE